MLTLRVSKHDAIHVAWGKPYFAPAMATNYSLEYRRLGHQQGATVIIVPANTSSHTITHLGQSLQ